MSPRIPDDGFLSICREAIEEDRVRSAVRHLQPKLDGLLWVDERVRRVEVSATLGATVSIIAGAISR